MKNNDYENNQLNEQWEKKENGEIKVSQETQSQKPEMTEGSSVLSQEPSDQIVSLKAQVSFLEKQAQENWDKALRALSELENLRRRTEKEIEKVHKFAIESFAESLLPVVDSLEQALQHDDKNMQQTMREGIELTLRLFIDVLNKHNIIPIDPLGEPFNPAQHEAMTMRSEEGVTPGTVLHVFQKGYLLNNRVLRPARVIVAKALEGESDKSS